MTGRKGVGEKTPKVAFRAAMRSVTLAFLRQAKVLLGDAVASVAQVCVLFARNAQPG